ncbi:uridine kinase [Thiotrichales bacterium 19S3-7]|nr:uridine kinase [Thiotrichales bacterium 19S3-7]MCF6802335.1 uridine kinase [Thiotrichales bacterium 19S3-11]
MSDKRLMIIGVAGASGSGKSLLANTIVNELGSDRVVVISEDHYYKNRLDLTLEERANINYDHPSAFDHELMKTHLKMLLDGQSIDVPIYDYATHSRTEEVMMVNHQKDIIVLEGILLFVDVALRQMMDIRIFMDTPLDICFIRRLLRDVEERGRSLDSVVKQYHQTVRPMFLQFIESSKKHADIIVPNGGKNRIAIDLIQAKLKELLNHD